MIPRIRLIAVGGTISTSDVDGSKLALPKFTGEDLIKGVPGVDQLAIVEVDNFSMVVSNRLSIEQVYQLARHIRDVLLEDPELTGVVVTHGTGTMEESAFMADLMVSDHRPVVFTGAMRKTSDPFTDSYFNIYQAIQIAVSSEAKGKGVMVALNSVIHSARDVYKSHTTNVDSFQSGEFGPLGYVYPDHVHFSRTQLLRLNLYTEKPIFDVDLIKFVVGMDDRFIRCSVESGAKGIIIEGSGLGNVNDSVAEGIRNALRQGVTVVICSRCVNGKIFFSYGTKVSARALFDEGCILAPMQGPKARILLMLALGITNDRQHIQKMFDPQRDFL
ncbi:asparaginase [Ammoniphilus resinae]|uniref:L-asparaginase n=1 Tax=Ammoniphilus resinae TaxID=861532 RepID=A0ABS4GQK5_9BACL|nr:asparaginase [Ammoniphilus resinae]MBP1932170.1 L-asparaginase [Ammoniphilus resinae]